MTSVQLGQEESARLADELRQTFLFATFSDEQLHWLIRQATVVDFVGGEYIFTQEQAPDALWVLLAGEWRLSRRVGGREVVLEMGDTPGSWAGWLPRIEDRINITALARTDCRMLRISREDTAYMLEHGFPIAEHLMAGLYYGVTHFLEATRQQERLAALGKLSSGLAHELNNPASAAQRAASQLLAALREQDRRALSLGRFLDVSCMEYLISFRQLALERPPARELDPLTRADMVDELTRWLDERGVPLPWELAPTLLSAGLNVKVLTGVIALLPPAAVADALCWFGASLLSAALACEIESCTGRISRLVDAVKDYTYMDQAPLQDVDVTAGLDNTLVMLDHRLRAADVEVVRHYDAALPRISALGSELNQVWTNIIDNAIDALQESDTVPKRIRVSVSLAGDRLLVEIADNGPGIPTDIQDRIFEPFFSTKDVGSGTGLGLDVAYRSVVTRHQGEILVSSQPGDTRFSVYLPLDGAR